MPLVAAGLPVLEPLGVRQHVRAGSSGRGPSPAKSAGSSVSAVFSNCWSREVSRSLTASAASWVVQSEEGLQHQHAVAQLALLLDLPLVGEQVVAQVHAVGEGVPQHPQRPGSGDGRRAPRRRSRTPPGPPTRARRRPCGASRCTRRGWAPGPTLMLDSSHSDSLSRCSVLSAKRAPPRPADIGGTVRAHRSARPASTGLAGSGTGVGQVHRHEQRAAGRGTPCRPPGPGVRLNISRKWSSKKKTQTYQSVTRESARRRRSPGGCRRTAARSRGRRGPSPPRCPSPPASPCRGPTAWSAHAPLEMRVQPRRIRRVEVGQFEWLCHRCWPLPIRTEGRHVEPRLPDGAALPQGSAP